MGLGGGPEGSFGASGRVSGSASRRRPLGRSSLCCRSRKLVAAESAVVTSTSAGSFRFRRKRPPRRESAESRLIGLQIGTGRSSSGAFEVSLPRIFSAGCFSDLSGALPLDVRPRPGFVSGAGFASAFALVSFFRNVTDAGAASAGGSISDFLLPRDFFSFASGSVLAAFLGFFLAMLKNCWTGQSRSSCQVRNKAS